ncbi:hypothetical protein [Ktedonospora formicarum]|uniref:DUF1772 domain-containing protein n=1 Tax=Ktedonospora formicarum TaxID=2778364 RepID=A0A8J3HWW7_9CHLR|nr:hypothetical protein [Ktedonospora formicarum]GHO42172.1 hypothetical protein KSX_03350 [Ktedonospora formicarum]
MNILYTVLFLVFVFTTFFNNGIQAYIHLEAYPLFAFVGATEFPAYLKEYERRLPLPLLLPYFATVLSNLLLLIFRPAQLSLVWLIVALVLNIAVTVVTLVLATPVYNRHKQAGKITLDGMRELLRINFLRLALSTLSSVIVIYLLCSVFTI